MNLWRSLFLLAPLALGPARPAAAADANMLAGFQAFIVACVASEGDPNKAAAYAEIQHLEPITDKRDLAFLAFLQEDVLAWHVPGPSAVRLALGVQKHVCTVAIETVNQQEIVTLFHGYRDNLEKNGVEAKIITDEVLDPKTGKGRVVRITSRSASFGNYLVQLVVTDRIGGKSPYQAMLNISPTQ